MRADDGIRYAARVDRPNDFTPITKQPKTELARTHGCTVHHVAVKHQNPTNEAGQQSAAYFRYLKDAPSVMGHRSGHYGTEGAHHRYIRRIDLEPACPACHGKRENRPAFVAWRYPEDKAFGSTSGDLRRLYVVGIPAAEQ